MTLVASRVASRRSRALIINYQICALCLALLWTILSSTTLACGDGADAGCDETLLEEASDSIALAEECQQLAPSIKTQLAIKNVESPDAPRFVFYGVNAWRLRPSHIVAVLEEVYTSRGAGQQGDFTLPLRTEL